MIEYDLSVCYGVMIPKEVEEELRNNWDADFYDDYVRCVNAWTCDEGWFFGLTKSLYPEDKPIIDPSTALNIPKFEIDRFERLIYEWKLEELVNWNPKYYIINFCY